MYFDSSLITCYAFGEEDVNDVKVGSFFFFSFFLFHFSFFIFHFFFFFFGGRFPSDGAESLTVKGLN